MRLYLWIYLRAWESNERKESYKIVLSYSIVRGRDFNLCLAVFPSTPTTSTRHRADPLLGGVAPLLVLQGGESTLQPPRNTTAPSLEGLCVTDALSSSVHIECTRMISTVDMDGAEGAWCEHAHKKEP